jgi:hypothetical protein
MVTQLLIPPNMKLGKKESQESHADFEKSNQLSFLFVFLKFSNKDRVFLAK